jgi:hypothetical protein
MRNVFASVLLIPFAALGGEPGSFVEQPNLVGEITEALVASKTGHLTPHSSLDGDRQFSYHLKSVSYLGTIQRGSEKFILATALFFALQLGGASIHRLEGTVFFCASLRTFA